MRPVGRLLGGAMVLLALVVPLGFGQTDPPAEDRTVQPLEYQKWKTATPGEYTDYNKRANLAQRGHRVYQLYCLGCHGETGDGNGPAAARLITKPRDFTSGVYKFRSTESGNLPTEADLLRTLTRGLSRVSMPAFPLMPERDKLAVIEYIKGFYPRWEAEKDRRTLVPVPRAPGDLSEATRVMRGRLVYLGMQCSSCHGVDGRGTGATRTEYVDAWGNPQKPFNLTRGSLKGGNGPEDIYRTFHTGLQSVMPSYGGETLAMIARDGLEGMLDPAEAEQLQPVTNQFPATVDEIVAMSRAERLELARRNSWDLVSYILSLRVTTSTAEAVLGSSD